MRELESEQGRELEVVPGEGVIWFPKVGLEDEQGEEFKGVQKEGCPGGGTDRVIGEKGMGGGGIQRKRIGG